MSSVQSVQSNAVHGSATSPASVQLQPSAVLLPEPTCAALSPADALTMLLMTAERMAQTTMKQTETRIGTAQKEIQELTAELLEQIQKEIADAKK